jgi:hypothetical protein
MAAYLVTIFLYRHNGGANDDNTMRQYIRWVEDEEESQATAGSGGRPTSRQLSNQGCRLCRKAAVNMTHQTMWWHNKWPPSAVA